MGEREDDLGLGVMYQAAGLRRPCAPWHVLRHSFAHAAVTSGISVYEVSKLLGHASVELTAKVYAHLSPGHLASQVAKFDYPEPKDATVRDINEARRAKEMDTQRETAPNQADIGAV